MIHNENSRVKIPAIAHLTRLGYTYLPLKQCKDEVCQDTNIFRSLFHNAVNQLNGRNLSDAEIDRAIREAAEYEATDGQRKAYIDARSEADTLIRQVEVAYKEKKKTIDSGARHQIKSSLSYIKKLVSRTKPGNVSEEQAAELQRAAAELRSAAGVLGI